MEKQELTVLKIEDLRPFPGNPFHLAEDEQLRDKYRLKELLSAVHMSKSSYCYQGNCLHKPDKYEELRTEVQTIFHMADKRYGYRRIHASLKKSGRPVSEKVVLRLMKEEGLAVSLGWP